MKKIVDVDEYVLENANGLGYRHSWSTEYLTEKVVYPQSRDEAHKYKVIFLIPGMAELLDALKTHRK